MPQVKAYFCVQKSKSLIESAFLDEPEKNRLYIQSSTEMYIVSGNTNKLTHKSLDLTFSFCKEVPVTPFLSMLSHVNTGFTLNQVHWFKAVFLTFLLFSQVLPDPACQDTSGRLPAPMQGEVIG